MQPPKPTIRFCVHNTTCLDERERLVNAGCELRDCLGRCGPCFDRRFVAVGETVIEGDDYDTIMHEAQRIADSDGADSEDACQNA